MPFDPEDQSYDPGDAPTVDMGNPDAGLFGVDQSYADASVVIKRGPYNPPKNHWGVPKGLPSANHEYRIGYTDALKGLYSMGSSEMAALQDKLLAGGFYGSSKNAGPLRVGIPDDDTAAAYERAIRIAARSGGRLSLEDVLEQAAMAKHGQGDDDEKTTRNPNIIRLTNRNDLEMTADAVARKIIGRKLRPEELERFIESYHTMEADVQQKAIAIKDVENGPDGTITDAPSMEAYAAAKFREENPQDAATVELTQGIDVFDSLLKGVGR